MIPALSFVIPLYNSEATIAALVGKIAVLDVPGGLEIILVNDGSADSTSAICKELVLKATVPIVFIEHARNFGEHNAVLTGWRNARGAHVVNLDDDGQNPPSEALRLWQEANASGLDVIFGHYEVKQHASWRNFGSAFTNRIADVALDKPKGFYLSSFRCVTAFVAKEVSAYAGPYPYIDGLILQITQRIGSIVVHHESRTEGESGYTLRRLGRLWLSSWVNFSVLPLRVATFLGVGMAAAGLLGIAVVFYLWITDQGPNLGWGSTMAALLIFSGTQLVLLGIIGEYLGRMFLTINQRPQSVVREIVRSL